MENWFTVSWQVELQNGDVVSFVRNRVNGFRFDGETFLVLEYRRHHWSTYYSIVGRLLSFRAEQEK